MLADLLNAEARQQAAPGTPPPPLQKEDELPGEPARPPTSVADPREVQPPLAPADNNTEIEPGAIEAARPSVLIPRDGTEEARRAAFADFMGQERPRPTSGVGRFVEMLRPQVAVWVDMMQLDNQAFRESLTRLKVVCSDDNERPVMDALQYEGERLITPLRLLEDGGNKNLLQANVKQLNGAIAAYRGGCGGLGKLCYAAMTLGLSAAVCYVNIKIPGNRPYYAFLASSYLATTYKMIGDMVYPHLSGAHVWNRFTGRHMPYLPVTFFYAASLRNPAEADSKKVLIASAIAEFFILTVSNFSPAIHRWASDKRGGIPSGVQPGFRGFPAAPAGHIPTAEIEGQSPPELESEIVRIAPHIKHAANLLEDYLEAHSIGNKARAGLVTFNQHDAADKIIVGAKTLLSNIEALQHPDRSIRASAQRNWFRSIRTVFSMEDSKRIRSNITQSMRTNPDLWKKLGLTGTSIGLGVLVNILVILAKDLPAVADFAPDVASYAVTLLAMSFSNARYDKLLDKVKDLATTTSWAPVVLGPDAFHPEWRDSNVSTAVSIITLTALCNVIAGQGQLADLSGGIGHALLHPVSTSKSFGTGVLTCLAWSAEALRGLYDTSVNAAAVGEPPTELGTVAQQGEPQPPGVFPA